MTTTHVQGLAELDRLLKELPAKLEGTVVRGGLRAGAVVIQAAARQNVPVKSGALRRSIKVSTGIKKGRVYSRVRAGDKVAFYAHMVEFGTAGHKITAKSGGMLNFGGKLVASVNHPGARQRPFMRPAIDGKASEAVEAMRKYMEQRTPAEIEKLKRGV